MAVVWKYRLPITDSAAVTMPVGAVIRHAALADQNRSLWVWVEIENVNGPTEERELHVVGTGAEIPQGTAHVATVQDPPFVWHVYDGGGTFHPHPHMDNLHLTGPRARLQRLQERGRNQQLGQLSQELVDLLVTLMGVTDSDPERTQGKPRTSTTVPYDAGWYDAMTHVQDTILTALEEGSE